ncbi:alpha-2,8-sialyltransferase 8E-like isoform X2 [Syngnathus scovelli]|uniref:alpha-2,8-sialyltransferase 8E-like isoform X2 n=1 Tax=Syngnathus scovelli TaxID=161590 RepID=UPI00211013BD|nr:alpha-2,8-sialyltransferase 8E-like isoform X2 [Syngnathus scovelli]
MNRQKALRMILSCLIIIILWICIFGSYMSFSAVYPPQQIPIEPPPEILNPSIWTPGVENAVITKNNTPLGSEIVTLNNYSVRVTLDIFKMLAKTNPFSRKMYGTCAVVGSGGILKDSGCGETIDSKDFVIRCNLPPLNGVYSKDVGVRTDLVTTNSSIFSERYESLSGLGPQQKFVEAVKSYGNAQMLMQTFLDEHYTQHSIKAVHALEDFNSSIRTLALNPNYIRDVYKFWANKDLPGYRPSTGLMIATLALDLCSKVHLYGFWPFDKHPHGGHMLTQHYYDDRKPDNVHNMPVEFDHRSKLDKQGILKLHLGVCPVKERLSRRTWADGWMDGWILL